MTARHRKLSSATLVALILGAFTSLASAATPVDVETRARAIGKELRCVVCQNQSIDESNAPLALDLKQLLRERLAAGDSDVDAKAFLVKRYGNFVLLKPPLQLNTLLLWIGPALLMAAALFAYVRYLRAGTPSRTAGVEMPAALSDDEKRRLQRLLAEDPAR